MTVYDDGTFNVFLNYVAMYERAQDVPQHDRLTTAEVAALCGWKPRTVAQYASRNRMPPPSGHFGRTPWWDRAVIVTWLEQRPGRGVGGGRPRKDTT